MAALTACVIAAVCFLSSPPGEQTPLRWAQTLSAGDVESIVVEGTWIHGSKTPPKDEFDNVVHLLNRCDGPYREDAPQVLSGYVNFHITTKDGEQHIVSNNGGVGVMIDDHWYDADKELLEAWWEQWSHLENSIPIKNYDSALTWAQQLKEGDVHRIEYIVGDPGSPDGRYAELTQFQVANALALINQCRATSVEMPLWFDGDYAAFYVTTLNGEVHTVCAGQTGLMIDGYSFTADQDWLAHWHQTWDGIATEPIPEGWISSMSENRASMRWARNLNVLNVESIEVYDFSGSTPGYRQLDPSQFEAAVALVNKSEGTYTPEPVTQEGGSVWFCIKSHWATYTLGMDGNLILQSDYYEGIPADLARQWQEFGALATDLPPANRQDPRPWQQEKTSAALRWATSLSALDVRSIDLSVNGTHYMTVPQINMQEAIRQIQQLDGTASAPMNHCGSNMEFLVTMKDGTTHTVTNCGSVHFSIDGQFFSCNQDRLIDWWRTWAVLSGAPAPQDWECPTAEDAPLQWARTLSPEDVDSITLVEYWPNGGQRQAQLPRETVHAAIWLINKCMGKYTQTPEIREQDGILFQVTMKDGSRHTLDLQAGYFLLDGRRYNSGTSWGESERADWMKTARKLTPLSPTPLEWAQNLSVEQVQHIEVESSLRTPQKEALPAEQFWAVVQMLNRIDGIYLDYSWDSSAQCVFFCITTADGVVHTICNSGGNAISIDNYWYTPGYSDASQKLFTAWYEEWSVSSQPVLPELPQEDPLLQWAKELTPSEVDRIELTVNEKHYLTLTGELLNQAVAQINQCSGTSRDFSLNDTGETMKFLIFLKDGSYHAVTNGGCAELRIDSRLYGADEAWLRSWWETWAAIGNTPSATPQPGSQTSPDPTWGLYLTEERVQKIELVVQDMDGKWGYKKLSGVQLSDAMTWIPIWCETAGKGTVIPAPIPQQKGRCPFLYYHA